VSPPQKGSPQEALFAGDKVELSPVNKDEPESRDLGAFASHTSTIRRVLPQASPLRNSYEKPALASGNFLQVFMLKPTAMSFLTGSIGAISRIRCLMKRCGIF
jgi:hypothetical protein